MAKYPLIQLINASTVFWLKHILDLLQRILRAFVRWKNENIINKNCFERGEVQKLRFNRSLLDAYESDKNYYKLNYAEFIYDFTIKNKTRW
jgi:hypothetical protein